MAASFHWVRVMLICNATENEELLHDTMIALVGTDEFETEISEGLHGNSMIVMEAELTKNREIATLFSNLGTDVIEDLLSDLGNRIDEDCVFYTRLDKQKAVQGTYRISHGGDVISITGKLVSHPAKKEIAMKTAEEFLRGLLPSVQPSE